MIDLHQAALLAGGTGLFLLGMGLMTDGLRLAAGAALKSLLARSTRTRWRALVTGFAATALVQSSSAVTVAAIGFVNAGLLALGPVLWVLFGSNVGTTVTGWLVDLLGLKVKIDALALPMIAAGALLGFFLEEIGPVVYNRAVAEVQERLAQRVAEIDIEVHEDEFSYWAKYDAQRKAGRR